MFVIGYFKMDLFVWGWVSELKVEDGVFYVKVDEVSSEFV